MPVSREHGGLSTKRRDQHQQRRFRKMEISQYRANHPKVESWIDEQVSLAASRLHAASLPRRVLERPDCSSANRHDSASRLSRTIDLLRSFDADAVGLAMQLVFFDFLNPHRLK